MRSDKPVILLRDCEATRIPSGDRIDLAAGSRVWITQSLGGGLTVTTDRGIMVRIAGKDGDALGLEKDVSIQPETAGFTEETGDIEKLVWDRLRSCFDPEIPVNIVELGLIYECRVTRLPQGACRVDVKFTLTAPGCGMGAAIKEDMESRIRALPGIKDVDVELVWDPPWNQSRMSERAKLQLGMI